MISVSEKRDNFYKEKELKIPYQRRALLLLESSETKKRMKGYALLTICFQHLPSDIRGYINKKWLSEKSFKSVNKSFIKYCNSVFNKESR
ncbi:MAG: hypothetical protein ACTSYV_02145 [Candidatus Heimdallarchaeaceae archaeon]